MNRIFMTLWLILFIFVFAGIEITAQILPPNSSQEDRQSQLGTRGGLQQDEDYQRQNDRRYTNLNDSVRFIYNPELNRKTTKEELATVKPEQNDLDKFAEFLRQPKTGLIKLIDGKGCNDKNLIDSTANCLKYKLPGNGASYSFRVTDYRIPELADLNFETSDFKCLGKFVQGIITTLGDVSLDKVDLQTAGLNFLTNFKPESKSKKLKEQSERFTNGVSKDGFTYRSEWKASENTTYVLRSIAYKREDYFHSGYIIPELDKRKDVIVAFRVVRKSDEGSITILWKELARKGSPFMKDKD